MYSNQRVKRHPELRPEIREWRRLIERYCNKTQDVPYNYNERALVGTFAAAAWLTGSPSLEEFVTQKQRGRRRESEPGRADLWILPRLGKRKHRYGCIFEAKWDWQSVGPRGDLDGMPEKCKKLLHEAKEDARRVKEFGKHLGLVFISPYLPEKEIKNVDDCIKKFISELKKIDADIAWTFPTPAFTCGELVYPGVAMLVG